MGIGVALEEAIDVLLATFISDNSAAISTALVPVALSGVTISLLFTARSMIAGELKDPIMDLMWRIATISFIVSLALGVGVYQSAIVEMINDMERGMIAAISGATSVGMLVDDLARPYYDLGTQLWNRAVTGFWPNFALLAAAAGVAVIQVALFAVGLGLYLLAKVGLALVLAVGPAFILCAIWRPTQKYAESWLGQTLNFVVLKLLIAMSIQMLTEFTSTFAAHIEAGMDTINIIKAVIALFSCGAALFVVMLNLPTLASALAGGGSISGVGRFIARALYDWLTKPRSKSNSPSSDGGSMRGHHDSSSGGGSMQGHPSSPKTSRYSRSSVPLFQRNTMEHVRSNTHRRAV
jgi:type IV secretion system protein VirB6